LSRMFGGLGLAGLKRKDFKRTIKDSSDQFAVEANRRNNNN